MPECPRCAQSLPDGSLVCQRGHRLRENWSTFDEARPGKKVWMHSKTGHQFYSGDRVVMPGSPRGYGRVKGLGKQGDDLRVWVKTEKGEFAVEPDSLRPFSAGSCAGPHCGDWSQLREDWTEFDEKRKSRESPLVRKLHKEWGELDRRLLPVAGEPGHPLAKEIMGRQRAINDELHQIMRGQSSPGLPEGIHDVTVVGAGPAGLQAAINGGTEGLDTLLIDANQQPGGQAGLSSRIENVLGFPAGVTGAQIAGAGLEQAQRVGVDTKMATRVNGMDVDPDTGVKTLHLDDGSDVKSRTVVMAGGVVFRKLTVPGADAKGVVYGDSTALKQAGAGKEMVLVGGGNSAGQAALDAAREAKHVTILLRHGALGDKMSDYLVEQIGSDPNISVEHGEIDHIEKDASGGIDTVHLKDGTEMRPGAVGTFIGSIPAGSWADVERDEKGFVKTGEGDAAPLETSIPGVFAAGDLRAGTTHRVIVASGDGAQAIAQANPVAMKMRQDSVEEAKVSKPKQPKKKAKADAASEFADRLAELDREVPFTGGDEDGPKDESELYGEPVREATSSRYDDMDAGALSKLIGKWKAMGDAAPGKEMLRATQAYARMIATGHVRRGQVSEAAVAVGASRRLAEDWAAWDEARKQGKFSHHVKAGPLPGHTIDSPGRGPTGKLRNFKSMSEEKLAETLAALKLHGEDPEAHHAAMAAAAEKAGVFNGDTIKIPAKAVGAEPGQILIKA